MIRNFQAALAHRGGWGNFFGGGGLLEHMYTNGDYPFKFGKLMGTDAGGNRYYENLVDYPFGQHRWVEPGDAHNYDPTSIPPEWHGWMHHMSDVPGKCDEELEARKGEIRIGLNRSDAIYDHGVGFTVGSDHAASKKMKGEWRMGANMPPLTLFTSLCSLAERSSGEPPSG